MKLLFRLIFIIAIFGVVLISTKKNDQNLSNIALKNIHLIALAQAEGESSLTGPREETSCVGLQNKHKMVCKCTNSYSCSDSGCY